MNRGSLSFQDHKPLFTLNVEDLTSALIAELANLGEANRNTLVARKAHQFSENIRSVLENYKERFGHEKAFECLNEVSKAWKDVMITIGDDATGEEIMGKKEMVLMFW